MSQKNIRGFISYATADSIFVEMLHQCLDAYGIHFWRDDHDMVSGSIERQVLEAIEERDVVVLVLSANSVKSDWVWLEIQFARQKEKREGRDILCPISIDDAWCQPNKFGAVVKYHVDAHQLEISYLSKLNVLSFARPAEFDVQFDKLIRGLLHFYGSET